MDMTYDQDSLAFTNTKQYLININLLAAGQKPSREKNFHNKIPKNIPENNAHSPKDSQKPFDHRFKGRCTYSERGS